MPRARKGTGTIYQRKSDGMWLATIETGWTENGTRRRIYITAKTRKEVARKLKDKQAQIIMDGTPASATSPTVKQWAEQWLENRKSHIRPLAFTNDVGYVKNWIVPTIGHRKLDALTPADVRAVTRAAEKAGLALRTLDTIHGKVKTMLTAAVAEGHQVPARARETPGPGKGESSRIDIPLDKGRKIMAEARKRDDYSRWLAAFLMGIRPGEARGLTWEMVDFDANTLTLAWQLKPVPYNKAHDVSSGFRVPRGYEMRHVWGRYHLVAPKTKAGIRVVPLAPDMRAALLEWREIAPVSPVGLVWPSDDGTPRREVDDNAAWAEIVEAAKVKIADNKTGEMRPPTLYEARHTAATLLLALGVDETTIKAILGHATILSTKAYLHADQARNRAALERAAATLTVEPKPKNKKGKKGKKAKMDGDSHPLELTA